MKSLSIPTIYGLMCVKNEADILIETLPKILEWCSVLFVIDNNSTDETQKILGSFGPNVVILGTLRVPYQEGFKSIGYHYAKTSKNFIDPDWWAVVDADEVYIEDPRDFLKSIPASYGRVSTNATEFIGLSSDVSLIDPKSYKYYIPLDWAETRFFRNTSHIKWKSFNDNGFSGARPSFYERIKLYHFPFRGAAQIEQRISDRNESRKAANIAWSNSDFLDAEQLLVDYKVNLRRLVSDGVCFGHSAVNHYSTRKQKTSMWMQKLLYVLKLR